MTRSHCPPEILEDRITPAPVFTPFNLLSDINGANGFTISGGGLGGVNAEIAAVANAGDVNGDGIKDLLVGIPLDSSNSKGRVALIFGKAGGFPINIDLDTLGPGRVRILGEVNFDRFGESVAGVGDVNADGFDDFVVGAPGQDIGVSASERGAAYVIFGKATWGPTFALSALDGTNGFKIEGEANARTGLAGIGQAVGGYNLAGAGAGGDFNGDGFDDILIGAQDVRAFPTGGASSGAGFVIFGKDTSASPFPAAASVAVLNGTNGLKIGSSMGNDAMGSEIGFVGDVNGDGLTDLSIGNQVNPQVGDRRSFIIFGKATGNPASINLDSLTAEQGFAGPASTNANFVGPISYGSEFVLRDIDNDGDQDLGVSFVHQQFNSDAIQGYTFVKNTGKDYTTNPFGNLSKEVRQGLLGFGNAAVDQQRFDLGDFNGDGAYDIAAFPPFVTDSLPDVFYGRTPTKTYIANNGKDSSGVSFTGLTIPVGNDDPQVFFVGDISGDGIDDVLVLPTLASSAVAAAPNAYVVFGDAFNPSADGKTVTLRDLDGDTVTVKTTKGQFTRDMFTFSSAPGAVPAGQQIDLLDLTAGDAASDAAFSGANLTVSVKKSATGDGRADLGAINATGIDLGNVVIAGGLGSIDAGNGADFDKPGLAKLDVYRFGKIVAGPAVPISDIVGRIGSMIVDTDFDGTTLNVTGAVTEGIGSLTMTGSLSSVVTLAGPLGSLKAGTLLAGTLLDVNGPSDKKTTITTKAIADGVMLEFATTIGKFTATQVGTATITAARIDTISVTGDPKGPVPLPGSFGGTVRAAGGIGSMTVKENFSGALDLIGASATLGTFKAFDLTAEASLNVDGTSTKKTSITAHVIGDRVVIDVASVIGKLTAARIDDATIIADRIDSLSVNGDSRNSIAGDLAADVTLDNAGAAGEVKALGTVKIAGRFHDAKITVAGSVGSFTAAAMQSASLFAGYTPTNAGQPLGGGTFVTGALLGKFTITGKVPLTGATPLTASMDDGFVVATGLGTISLAAIDSTTGATEWGFAYRDAIKSLKVKEPGFTYNVAAGGQQTTGDFSVRVL